MPTPYQAIKFVMLDFGAGWERMMLFIGYSSVRYTATKKDGSRLAVVFEGTTGEMRTYIYRVPAGQEVYVLDQVIHIPTRCEKEKAGNKAILR